MLERNRCMLAFTISDFLYFIGISLIFLSKDSNRFLLFKVAPNQLFGQLIL